MFPYQNPALSAAERAEDLLARMTVEEKIGQTVMEIVCAFPDEKSAIEKVRSGCFGSFILSTTAFPGNLTASGINIPFLNRCQKAAVEESRLGIPLIFGRCIVPPSLRTERETVCANHSCLEQTISLLCRQKCRNGLRKSSALK